MGAKTDITQAPTMTPQQKALLDSMMRGVSGQLQGFPLGEGWAGPSFDSYRPGSGYGGSTFNMGRPATPAGPLGPIRGGGAPVATAPGAGGGFNPMMAALNGMARVPSATAPQPSNPGAVNPFSPAAYSNREQLVSPLVNPFRRNLGG